MKYIISASLLFLCLHTQADGASDRKPARAPCPSALGSDLPLLKGNKFKVAEYNPETESYLVYSVRYPDESDMHVTLESMAQAAPKIEKNKDVILRNPQDIVGEQYTARKNMNVLSEKELEARRGCHRR